MKTPPDLLRILVPLDGSPLSESILPSLQPLLAARKAELTLLRVISRVEDVEREKSYLSRLERDLRKEGVRVGARLEFGRPADEILHLAKPGRFDFLAMTTHGHSAILRVIMGSVAARVLRQVEIPLLLHTPKARITDWKRIVVSLDGTAMAETVLEDVIPLAEVLGSTVHLVRVNLPLLPMGDPYFDPVPIDLEGPRKYVEEISDRLVKRGILAIPEVREGFAAREIVKVAARLDAGLIAMATEGRASRAGAVERSIAREVLPATPCTLLLRRTQSSAAPPDLKILEADPIPTP